MIVGEKVAMTLTLIEQDGYILDVPDSERTDFECDCHPDLQKMEVEEYIEKLALVHNPETCFVCRKTVNGGVQIGD